MRVDGNGGKGPNYWPSSFGGPDVPEIEFSGEIGRFSYNSYDNTFEQTSMLYSNVLTDEERNNLIENIVSHLGKAEERIQYRQATIFFKVNKDYDVRIAKVLKLNVERVTELSKIVGKRKK